MGRRHRLTSLTFSFPHVLKSQPDDPLNRDRRYYSGAILSQRARYTPQDSLSCDTRPEQEQHPGQENQDSQHMLNQPRGSFPDLRGVWPLFLEIGLFRPFSRFSVLVALFRRPQRARGRSRYLRIKAFSSDILGFQKDPAALKALRDSELLRKSVSTTPPICTTLRTLL